MSRSPLIHAAEAPANYEPLDRSLALLHRHGAEWMGGLSSHATMVAEALEHVGRSDAIESFVAHYIDRLEPSAPVTEPIKLTDWNARLGDRRSGADWVAFFHGQLADDHWTEVVSTWVPRLTPGFIAAATHGLIRTSHAVRSLSKAASAPRVDELAHALGYWATTYAELSDAVPSGDVSLEAALALVPPVDVVGRRSWMITDRIGAIDPAQFSVAVSAAHLPTDIDEAILAIAELGAGMLLTNPQAEIAFVHAVTAPTAVLSLVPYLTPEDNHRLVAEAWKAVAALWAGYGVEPPISIDAVASLDTTWREIVDAAVADGDEHHIKVAVALADLAAVDGENDALLRATACSVL